MRHKSPSAVISKAGLRDDSSSKHGPIDGIGPGTYENSNTFGYDAKGTAWAMSSEKKVEIDERDYGHDLDKAYNLVKTRAPAA